MHLPPILMDTWFSACVGLFGVLFVAWKLWRSTLKQTAKSWSQSLRGWASSWRKTRTKGTANWRAVWFAVLFSAILVYGASRQFKENIVTMHDVAILHREDNGDFAFVSKEKPGGDTFRPCSKDARGGVDTIELLTKGIGYIAETARWEETGTCKSILRSDLGFDFKDMANNFTYRRVQ